eukprot:CAMPEP_0181305396 /NCGR_PEP_ID=MMETSP1101-20121128/9702_1 /TAXON_ID=46948 /ORGANISM="Rhodomonas abbreviata, Strain Caron Lab Isolate" /LENGTH=350 /DNA_ID=CAMNT_0023411299 /DNA_START=229 /DNA_END=1278 /DNA_ORIENTATION=-
MDVSVATSDFTHLALGEDFHGMVRCDWSPFDDGGGKNAGPDRMSTEGVIQFSNGDDLGGMVGGTSNALDLGALAERCMDDFDLVAEVIESFCEQSLARMRSLDSALESWNVEQITFDLDFLSGAAKNVGALALDHSIARMMEFLCGLSSSGDDYQNDPAQIGCRKKALNDIFMEFWRAVRQWKEFWRQTGNEDSDDLECSTRLEHFLASHSSCDGSAELSGSSWSATEDELQMQQDVEGQPRGGPVAGTFQKPSFSDEILRESNFGSVQAMDAFFEECKMLVGFLRNVFPTGHRGCMKEVAEAIHTVGGRAGLNGLSRKAEALMQCSDSALRIFHVDALEQQLDASMAIW